MNTLIVCQAGKKVGLGHLSRSIVPSLVSSTQGVGIKEGIIEIGDEKNIIKVSLDKSKAALIGLLSHSFIKGKYLTRLMLSDRELEDTSKKDCFKNLGVDVEFCYK